MVQAISSYEYILIDIANQFGLDKLTWNERIEWTQSNLPYLEDLVDEAKKPFLYAKAINALRTVRKGLQTNHLVGLDASASGLSIMGMLIGCCKTLEQTNLIYTGKVQDPYTNVTTTMQEILGSEFHVEREDSKRSLMTVGYGSKLQPLLIYGENTPELAAFHKARKLLVPGTIEVSDDLRSLWNSNSGTYQWTLPDGHIAKVTTEDQELTNLRIQEVYGIGTGFTYSYTKRGICTTYDTPIIANIVQSLDAWIAREMVRECYKSGFHILTVHDAFYCHPNNVHEMRRHYREICSQLTKLPVMESIGKELLGYEIEYQKYELGLEDLILESEYAIS